MANTKANIYPVQLEGATLNINQYNAEIKQFAGFNRLNSPYVGGCLSNIWQKDTTIEGATKDNTYIAPNGDIYRVDTTGFYENNNKLVDYSDNKFYGVKKLNLPVNTVKAINEKIYVTEEGGNYVAHWGDGYTQTLSTSKTDWKSFVDIAYDSGCIVFTSKTFKKVLFAEIGNDATLNVLYVPADTESTYFTYVNTYSYVFRYDVSQTTFFTDSYFIVAPNLKLDRNGLNTFDTTNYSWLKFTKNTFTKSTVMGFSRDSEISSSSLFSLRAYNYYLTSSGDIYYTFMYDFNSQSTNITPTADQMITSGTLYDKNGSLQLKADSVKKCRVRRDNTAVQKKSSSMQYDFEVKGILTPVGCNYLINYQVDTDSLYWIKGYITNSGTCISGNDASTWFERNTGSFSTRGNFKILFNNNQISGISVVADNSTMGNLVTDWNSIKEDTLVLFNNDTELTYCDSSNGVFYTIFEATPSLSLKYNQVVTNSNNQLNSVSIDSKKILHFAPDWNNSTLEELTGNFISKDRSTASECTVENKYFFASAINEYNQVLNNSIILNPIKTIYAPVNSGLYGNIDKITAINIYTGKLTDNKCIYNFSICDTYNENPDLVGLPYPTDTNGNVSYCPNIFSKFFSDFGNNVFVKNNSVAYPLSEYNNKPVMSYYLGSMIEGLEETFVIQGQYYGIIDRKIFAFTFSNGVAGSSTSVVSVQGLKYCGSTPYMALFWSETNRTLYSFTGSNTLTASQSIDKVSTVIDYDYNPATQSTYLITDIGVIIISNMGTYILEIENIVDSYLLDNGAVFFDDSGNYHYIAYYKPSDEYVKKNIELETCFYGADNTTVSINDTLYLRLFSPDKEAGEIVVSAVTISNEGKKTEKTTFKIKASDWDADTNSIYLRYQPKQQRGLGTSFAISSPFKIASISVGNTLETILVDKISKTAINAPAVVSKNTNW